MQRLDPRADAHAVRKGAAHTDERENDVARFFTTVEQVSGADLLQRYRQRPLDPCSDTLETGRQSGVVESG